MQLEECNGPTPNVWIFWAQVERTYCGNLDMLSHVTVDMLCTRLEVNVKHVESLMTLQLAFKIDTLVLAEAFCSHYTAMEICFPS